MYSYTAVYPSGFGMIIGTGVNSYDVFVGWVFCSLLCVSFFCLLTEWPGVLVIG